MSVTRKSTGLGGGGGASLSPVQNLIEGSGDITANGYGDLSDEAGPSVIATTEDSVLVEINCAASNTGGLQSRMSFEVSGATTRAAGTEYLVRRDSTMGTVSGLFLITGLTPGENTFTAKYMSGSAVESGTFGSRRIMVIPL